MAALRPVRNGVYHWDCGERVSLSVTLFVQLSWQLNTYRSVSLPQFSSTLCGSSGVRHLLSLLIQPPRRPAILQDSRLIAQRNEQWRPSWLWCCLYITRYERDWLTLTSSHQCVSSKVPLLALATDLLTCLGCVYRWYSSSQICDILQKFDGVAFIGDESLADAYAGFNILLRENLATGALKDWEMNDVDSEQCRCDSQFTNPTCWLKRISSSEDMFLPGDKSGPRSTYACSTRKLSTSRGIFIHVSADVFVTQMFLMFL